MSFSSIAHTEDSPIFNLWLSQWRLSTLDSESAMPVLTVVIKSMLAESGQWRFWQHVEQFLSIEADGLIIESSPDALSIADTGMLEGSKDQDSRRQLAERAERLQPPGAKCLLEYLSRSYSLEGENASFWQIVANAIQLCEIQKDLPSAPLM